MSAPSLRLRHPRYRALRVLGRGASAVVWLALDLESGRQVAVKLLTGEDPGWLTRVGREVELLRRHPHEALVPLLASELEASPPLLVFDYLPGGSLEDHFVVGEPWPASRVREVARRVGAALEHLHARGALHRDVKPANILLDAEGRASLADLGLGRDEASRTLTATGAVVGTARYMDPEVVVQGAPQSPASDRYALAVTLAELATGTRARGRLGERPFDEGLLRRIEAPGLRAALRAGLRVLSDDRPRDLAAFLELLEAPGPSPRGPASTATLGPDPRPPARSPLDPRGGGADLPPAGPGAAASLEVLSRSAGVAPARIPAPGPSPARARGPGAALLGVVAGAALAAAWLSRGGGPSPEVPTPASPRLPAGTPLGPTARLVPGGRLRVDLLRPARLAWVGAEGPAELLPAGSHRLPLPPRPGRALELRWSAGGVQGTGRWRLEDLLDYLLVPLEGVAGAAPREPGSPELGQAAEVHRVLVGVAPRMLGREAPRALQRRLLAALEVCQGLLLGAGVAPDPAYPPESPGAHGLGPAEAPPPGTRVLAGQDLEQPGNEVDPDPARRVFRLVSYRQRGRGALAWRQFRTRILLRWPALPGDFGEDLRVAAHTSASPPGVRLSVHRRGDLGAPGELLFRLGGEPEAELPAEDRGTYWARIPAALLPEAGEPLELRLEDTRGRLKVGLGVFALSLTPGS